MSRICGVDLIQRLLTNTPARIDAMIPSATIRIPKVVKAWVVLMSFKFVHTSKGTVRLLNGFLQCLIRL